MNCGVTLRFRLSISSSTILPIANQREALRRWRNAVSLVLHVRVRGVCLPPGHLLGRRRPWWSAWAQGRSDDAKLVQRLCCRHQVQNLCRAIVTDVVLEVFLGYGVCGEAACLSVHPSGAHGRLGEARRAEWGSRSCELCMAAARSSSAANVQLWVYERSRVSNFYGTLQAPLAPDV